MRIGIDIDPLLQENLTGIPLYVDSLIQEFLNKATVAESFVLVTSDTVARQWALLNKRSAPWRNHLRLRLRASTGYDVRLTPRFPVLGKPPLHWVVRKIDGRLLIPVNSLITRASIGPLDVFHHTTVARGQAVCARRHVCTIYDITPRLFRETHTPEVIGCFEESVRLARTRADRIITISEATRRDVIEHLQIAPDRVQTIPLAARTSLPRDIQPEVVTAVREKIGLKEDDRYILAGGSLEPRKNLPRLIEAFAALISDLGADTPLRLVLAGARQHGADAVRDAIERYHLSGKVIVTGYVSDEELSALMTGCACFAYPSIYEGFGLPVLEAMALGAPVVTSNVSSLPEVAGNAALLVDPYSVDAIADALRRVLSDAALAACLRQRGREQERRFSWERTAAEHLSLYKDVAEVGR